MTEAEIYRKVLITGPDIQGCGGMASVLQSHRDNVFGKDNFRYIQSNNRRGTFAGAFNLLVLLSRLPIERLRGRKILHIHASHGKSFYRKLIVSTWAKILGFKTIVQWHGGNAPGFLKSRTNRFFFRQLIRQTDNLMVFPGIWEDLFSPFRPKKTDIISNSISKNENTKKPHNPVTFLFLGGLSREKGVFELIDAFERLNCHSIDWRLYIAGKGPEERNLKRIISQKGLQNKIELCGWINDSEKRERLKGADILVLPSHFEAFPVSILEGMSYGMPIIASNVGSIPEIVNDGKNGFLIDPGNIRQLHDSIMAYLSREELIGIHGRTSYGMTEDFSHNRVTGKLTEVYRAILIA